MFQKNKGLFSNISTKGLSHERRTFFEHTRNHDGAALFIQPPKKAKYLCEESKFG